jgi:hypothetical protein
LAGVGVAVGSGVFVGGAGVNVFVGMGVFVGSAVFYDTGEAGEGLADQRQAEDRKHRGDRLVASMGYAARFCWPLCVSARLGDAVLEFTAAGGVHTGRASVAGV